MDNLSASINIINKNNVWIDDNMVTTCYNFDNCKVSFGFFQRKHHCRSCGNIFCSNCSSKAIVIPDFVIDRPEPADYWNPSYYVKGLKGIEERVCDQCYISIKSKIRAHEKIIEFIHNPKSIDYIKESIIDSNVRDHYLDHMRNIQYYLPNHIYSQIDKKILKANAKFFSQHSKYLVHLIKSIDWNSSSESESIISILNSEKCKTCEELYCTRTCHENLTFDDCIDILYSCASSLPDEIINHLFEIMKSTPEEVIACNLTFFCSLIKKNPIENLHLNIYNLVCESISLVYQIYWLLIVERSNVSTITNIEENYVCVIDNFLELFDKAILSQICEEYCFYSGLIANLDNPKEYLINNFDKYKPIPLPYNPEIQLIGVYINSITVKQSYTKPVIITFKTNVGNKRILFKRESIINDLTVLNLIKLSNIILNETLEINLGAITYPVMPITENSGMIEIVENAETVHSICSDNKEIWQYIFEKNRHKIVSEVMETYMHSLVLYTLHSYFIGLGDRHLQNIMVTDDGKIFHIDFGFILGKDPYPITSTDIKLNKSVLSILGSTDSEMHQMYLDLCSLGVMILRKYFGIFFVLLNQIQSPTIKEKHIEKFIMNRFQPRQNDKAVFDELLSVIQHSNNAFTDIIRDYLYFHSQEKTIQKGIINVIKGAKGMIKMVTNPMTSSLTSSSS